jgi:hypothetical protein
VRVNARLDGDEALLRGLRAAGRGFTRAHVAQVERALEAVSREAARQAPRDRGILAGSVRPSPVRVGTGGAVLVGEVVVDAPHGFFVARGRRRGARLPPHAPLAAWAARRGVAGRGAVYLIRRAISRRGIPRDDFLQRAFRATRDEVRGHLRGLGRRVVLLIEERNPFA